MISDITRCYCDGVSCALCNEIQEKKGDCEGKEIFTIANIAKRNKKEPRGNKAESRYPPTRVVDMTRNKRRDCGTMYEINSPGFRGIGTAAGTGCCKKKKMEKKRKKCRKKFCQKKLADECASLRRKVGIIRVLKMTNGLSTLFEDLSAGRVLRAGMIAGMYGGYLYKALIFSHREVLYRRISRYRDFRIIAQIYIRIFGRAGLKCSVPIPTPHRLT
ncbi:hypothetical protein PUN28_008099 [Cardiocondyla obscurior]|uniref:Uncharacterized protein n=1 Tax=Cardiocondyla obscurior TaxID=286306 RepID=A0AAW2G1F0_9HYME